MFEPVVILALDFDSIVRLGILLIFVLGPVLKGLFGGGGVKPKPARRNRPPQRPPQAGARPPQVGGAGGGGAADQLENEIEEFLRRAAGGKPPARNNPPRREAIQAEVVQAEVVQAEVIEQPTRRLAPARKDTEREASQKAKNRNRAQQKRKVRSKVKAQRKKLDPVGGNADELGADVSREIDEMESHVHDVFDHKLGSLGESSHVADDIDDRGTDSEVWEGAAARRERAAQQRDKQAAAMKQMIRDPDSVHQAVIMAEILKRPDF